MWPTAKTLSSPSAEAPKMKSTATAKLIPKVKTSHRDNNGIYPTSRTLSFPYPTGPYPQQAALMDALLEGIPRDARQPQSPGDVAAEDCVRKTRILALESPTGTGKSLSLACAGLAWLDYEEGLYYSNNPNAKDDGAGPGSAHRDTNGTRTSPTSVVETTRSSTGIDWLDSWQPQDDKAKEEQVARERDMERHEKLVEALENLRLRLYPVSKSTNPNGDETSSKTHQQQKQKDRQQSCERKQRHRERRENLLRMALTKSKMDERKRARDRNRKRKRNPRLAPMRVPRLAYEEESEDAHEDSNEERWKRKIASVTPGTSEWLLLNPYKKGDHSHQGPPSRPPQIVYAARTHSQLSQFVQEIRKTKWGRKLRVVALGSRGQGLCGALTKTNNANGGSRKTSSASEAMLTEACLELRKKSSGGNGCSHYSSQESVSTLALHGMVEATDLEDMVQLGRATKTCSYYAARAAVPHAQLVVLPYASLCSRSSREALGLDLHSNTLVLVDEAHNLPSTIANLTSATLAIGVAIGARHQLDNYLKKYVDRLSPHHLRLLGDLKRLIRGLISSMNVHGQKSQQRLQSQKQDQACQQEQRYLLSSSQFLVSQRLETINLFPVLRYMKESKLSQKLLGFMEKSADAAAIQTEASSNSSTPSQISPMSVVESFLEKLTYASDDDGQVVIDKGDQFQEDSNSAPSSVRDRTEAHLRFCVLNPAVQANDDLWTAPRAVALVGGTLQPLDVMMRELIPGRVADHAARAQSSWNHQHGVSHSLAASARISNPYRRKQDLKRTTTAKMSTGGHGVSKQTKIYRSDDFWAFTCGHVVDPSHVLLQSLTRVGKVSIDVRHKTRSTPSVTNAIGTALVKLCQSVRHGLVVFLPSYKYEAILVDAWKRLPEYQQGKNGTERSIWDQLQQATTVVREPKEASQVEATLALYSRAASRSPRGALLLSVVGGKLSEGINFADDLCRCVVVVGLPFADRSDPLLQEKLKLVAATGGTNETIPSRAASDYYRSICLRSVNQSVGRAIRHAKDWATIILMDTRYPSDAAIAKGLPSWLTDSTPSWKKDSGDLEEVIARTEAFFDRRYGR